MEDVTHVTVGGAPEGYDAQLVLNEMRRRDRPVMHIARDDKRLAAMEEALRFYAPDVAILWFPSWDCLPYDRISPQADISATSNNIANVGTTGFKRSRAEFGDIFATSPLQ